MTGYVAARAAEDVVPELPPRIPRFGNTYTRRAACALLRWLGWRVTGNLPDRPRLIVIAAPHTSNWDWVIAMVAMLALGIRISYLMKASVFVWPLSVLLRASGGIPIDRSSPAGLVDDVVARLRATERIVMVITPEGTRSRVESWKTGFLRIAERAEVPVVQVAWHYPGKLIHLGPVAELSGDHERDIARIRAWYRHFTGRNPQNQSP
ncbi:MAG: hypothetical protein CALGDGBN_00126 [Pseudomonadales bacterium]|nr:hypothetical protein [Pseudomonadales bacterium]